MFDIDKLYELSVVEESNNIKDDDIIIKLEKSYYDELLKANKKFIDIQKKNFKSFMTLDKQDKKNISKEIMKVLLGKEIKVKNMDTWFKKTSLKLGKFILDDNKNISIRYTVVSEYLRKDKYSDFARISISIPEDIKLFKVEDKDIQSNISDGKLYKQLINIMDLTDIITWKNHPTPKPGMFIKKLQPEYLFGSIRDIDLAMNKTHCEIISKGSYKAVDIIKDIDVLVHSKKKRFDILVSLIKDVRQQIELYKNDSKRYMESYSNEYKLTQTFLDDMDYILNNLYYIYRRFIKQVKDVEDIYGIIINDLYDRLLKYRERENGFLNKDYNSNRNAISIDKIDEAKLPSKERNSFDDNAFGIPSLRKYPLNDKAHVLAAIRMFNHVDAAHEKELAMNIIKKMKEYNISPDRVGDDNRLKKYL